MAPESERAMTKCPNCGKPKDAPDPFGCEAVFHWTDEQLARVQKREQPTLTCSEVVERLIAECVPLPFKPSINRTRAEKILAEWRERRVQELEEALELCMGVIWGEFHTGPTDDMTGDNEADIAYRAGQNALANSEQIRKGAKHESDL